VIGWAPRRDSGSLAIAAQPEDEREYSPPGPLVQAGLAHHQAGRRAEAEQCYAEALACDPEEATALYLLGVLAFETGRPDEAASLLQRVCELRPRNVEARFTLAGVRHWRGELAAAIEAYRGVLARAPDHAGALIGLANALGELGDRAGALEAGRAAASAVPDDPDAQAAFASALAASGQTLAAISAWREAVRLDPERLAAHVSLALALIEAGEAAAALAAADRALALDPALADAWFARGAALSAAHRYAEAIEPLERSVALGPARAAALIALGGAYAELEQPALAEAHLLAAIAVDARAKEAHASLGAVYLMSDHPAAARAAYEAALAIDPDMVAARQSLAGLLAEAGQMDAARAHRDRAYGRQSLFVEPAPDPERRVLILTTAEGGNTPFRHLLPKDRYTRILWFIAYAKPGEAAALPAHDVVFNAIADPDRSGAASANLAAFAAASDRPMLNNPERIARTGRDQAAALFAGLDDVIVPRTARVSRAEIAEQGLAAAARRAGLSPPLLVRPAGSHGGKGLILADTWAGLEQPVETDIYLTAFLDFASLDGFYRKYRMIFVGQDAYPYHLAISRRWLVHHGAADMAGDPARIAEEMAFLRDPAAAIGARALAAVEAIGRRLDLDFAGVDFALAPDGRVILFEANATMLVHPESATSPFAAKNPYVAKIIAAFQRRLAGG
jgi:tetratricopeptide (TPR) repeat protein